MNNKDKLDYLRYMSGRIYDQVSFSEAKHGLLVAADTALIASAIGVASSIEITEKSPNWELPLIWFVAGWITLLAFISLIISIKAIIPSMKNNGETKPNLYFHKDVAEMDTSKTYDACIDENNEIEDIENENIAVAKIIKAKNASCKRSALIMIDAIFPPAILFDFYLGIRSAATKHHAKK